MVQFFRLRYTLLLLIGVELAAHAQVSWQDSVSGPGRVVQTPDPIVGRLKASMRRLPASVAVADSLLAVARQLDYAPGQVVALANLAYLYAQQQQPDQTKALLQEATRQAERIHEMNEVGWAMGQLGRLQGMNRQDVGLTVSLGQVMGTLGATMTTIGLAMNRRHGRAAWAGVPTPFRLPDRRPAPASPTYPDSYLPPMPPSTSPRVTIQLRNDLIDRWVDTLIRSPRSNPRVVQQLTVHRKLRDSSQALSKAFAKEGDYAQAYRYYLQYAAYKDSLTAEATTRRVAALTYKQNLLRKEIQIQLLTKDRQLREQAAHRQQLFVLALLGGVILLIALLVVLSRNNRAKQLANQQLNAQKEALQGTLAELKATQAQLIQREKMASLGEVTAGIAHEIQNPLNFVNNFSDVNTDLINELAEQRQQPQRDEELEGELLDDIRLNMRKISEHGNRAAAIVKGMVEHARSSGGERALTDLNELTEEYFKLAYHGIRARDKAFDAKLTTVLAPGLTPVTVVPQEVGRVLLNVFNNAFYAVQKRQQTDSTDYAPEVAVITDQVDHHIRIQVRDNGTGVPVAIREKVFQPFFTTKPTGQGTGLGLSLSYDIITKGYGGTLTLDSKEGEFTELTVTLPTTRQDTHRA